MDYSFLYLLQMKQYANQKLITCQVESRLDSVTKIMGGGGGEIKLTRPIHHEAHETKCLLFLSGVYIVLSTKRLLHLS